MELKVWVDGVQRIVCGVTEVTTCQEVVIALAQAIGRTGRYTLIEKWRETERHLAPHENPIVSLNKWGQYASDVQLILKRTGPSLSERPTSDGMARAPERGLYRQSLPPLAKLRPTMDRSLKRKEPKRKSLTFTGGAKGLMDIFGRGREVESKQRALCSTVNGGVTLTGPRAEDLARLVQLQKEKLQMLEEKLEAREVELQDWAERHAGASGDGSLEEEILRLEQRVRKNAVEIEEEEFWENELQIEQENEKQLQEQLQELRRRIQDCEAKLSDYAGRIQDMEAGIEAERLQQEMENTQQVNEEEVRAKLLKVKAELDMQSQQMSRLESSCKAVERSLGQSSKRLQEKEQELEQLTRELRQVNLQQFIQQTGTKVTVLPAEPGEEEAPAHADMVLQSGSLKRPPSTRPLPSSLQILQSSLSSGFNPEGIYV
ncbi:ras association domain-containing protein 8-like [Scleropages formosus]|uniref:Ras association domain family member 8 n=1 Tax=Scleropages formosus TaxID=113540 RepID=A0A0P7UTL1_SCLFO|nr:ras association domain-containing protein 8-like [Scleropages formosus]XP_018595063.1 ras association domain-containing protein 8-like [Scleropages formosus]XP_018595064.1 ras association domain-containing protein 8-like [Scleropages formosus]XP_029108073.1 ras association domain-containing protein 8-like [Scleropages formosus]KPP73179.1 ras association domain-containing protein 8-like [Scleropages formosus]